MKGLLLVAGVVVSTAASAGFFTNERPKGFKIGERMIVNPSVSFSYTYDGNVDTGRGGLSYGAGGSRSHSRRNTSSWSVSPRLTFSYDGGENWGLNGGVGYSYSAYQDYNRHLNHHGFNQNLSFSWNDEDEIGRNWAFSFSESYSFVPQNDDMSEDSGKGIWRDRQQFNFSTSLSKGFTERFHGGINGSFNYLNYANDKSKYGKLWGWDRWTAGANLGYTLTPWTDLQLSGSYSGYIQSNRETEKSDGWTVQGGVGTRATPKVSYRVMGGWSHFRYASHASDGFTYSVSGDWKMNETWHMMLMASSYYQPSEREYDASSRNDCLSWGIAHTMVRGALNATFDIAYRHGNHQHTSSEIDDYDEDFLTFRLGASYSINRYLSVFANGEYQTETTHKQKEIGNQYDYDRWRFTVGFSFTY